MNWRIGAIGGWFFAAMALHAQEVEPVKEQSVTIPIVDSLYREDQFYAAVTYNTLVNTPEGFSQDKFSTGLTVGFLRDVPLNPNRTIAIAAGAGFAYSIYHHTMRAYEADGDVHYELIPDNIDYASNRTSLHELEFPIELRWRTSTFQSHKFWRIYTGVKFSYNLRNRMYYRGEDTEIRIVNNEDLRKWRTGIYLAAGYNTWNFYAYYGLNSLFDGAELNGKPIKAQALHLGLQFYIL